MRFELGLEEPQRNRASRSAITIALSYVVGGLVPLVPYMVGQSLSSALTASVAITLVALLLFGGIKGKLTGAGTVRSAVQTVVIGGLAAGAAYTLARLLSAH
jgi:vacuolar iron transporter family protein